MKLSFCDFGALVTAALAALTVVVTAPSEIHAVFTQPTDSTLSVLVRR